jgi:hypothetical protein
MFPLPPAYEGTYLRQASLSNRNEASVEAAYQKEETMAILDRCGRLAKAKSE